MYIVSQKRHQTLAHNFFQMLTGFQNAFICRLSEKFATNHIYIFHHTFNISLHYFVKYEYQ